MIVDIKNGLEDFQPAAWDASLPPSWRYEDARRLAGGEEAEWPADDPTIVACAEYCRAMNAAEDDTEKAAVKRHWSAIAVAHEIAGQNDPRRWELEARLLARQTDDEISIRCGLSPEVISRYEELFFNVRCRLEAWGWVCSTVIGNGLCRGFQDHEVANLWAWVAMGGGPLVLDTMIQAFHTAWRPGEPPILGNYLRADVGIDPRVQAMVAGAVLPPYGPAGEAWQGFHLLLLEARSADDPDRRALLRQRARDGLIDCGRAFLAGKPLPRPRRRPQARKKQDGRSTKPRSGRHKDSLNAELREVLSHTVGFDPRLAHAKANGPFVPPRSTDRRAVDRGTE